jgi:phosphoribosyl-dephospho-CoA transferase
MAVVIDVRPHDLLRIRCLPAESPDWAVEALRIAPWVVVRRDVCAGRVPVGVRGTTRAQRFATAIDAADIDTVLAPSALRGPGLPDVPAAQALPGVADVLDAAGVDWGPTGSAGFTLASGVSVLTRDSDLDVVIRLSTLPASTTLTHWHSRFATLPARVDCQLDLPSGGVALGDVVGDGDRVLLRTARGPVLVTRAELSA